MPMADRKGQPAEAPGAKKQQTQIRRGRYRRGLWGETLAGLYLMAKGYRILARRHKTPAGEIDLIAAKGRLVAFIEVKRRPSLLDCEASITPALRARVHRAADIWLSRRPKYQAYDLRFDAIFIVPRLWPVHLENNL